MNRASAICSLFLILLLIASAMSGCVGNLDVNRNRTFIADNSNRPANTEQKASEGSNHLSGEIVRPSSYTLKPYEIRGDAICLVDENDYEGVPILVPVFKNHNKMVSLAWKDSRDSFKKNKLTYTDIDFEDVSEFSSKIALTFYETSESQNTENGDRIKAIVVDSYENSLLAGPIACILDIPILRYGPMTNEVLWRTGIYKAENVIAIGNTPYSNNAGIALKTQFDVWNFTISLATDFGVDMNYIVVTNPDDNEGLTSYFPQNSKTPYTPHLSCFASMFAALRNGIVVCCDAADNKAPSPELIDKSIESVAEKMRYVGIESKFLLMVGDSISLPFAYYWFNGSSDNLGKIPTDNVYADLGGSPTEGYDTDKNRPGFPSGAKMPELASGRIIAKNLSGMSMYFDRMVNYMQYLAVGQAPSTPQMDTVPNEWNNNAFTYNGLQAEWGWPEEIQSTIDLFLNGKFNVKEGSVEAKGKLFGYVLAEYVSMSNFIVSGGDHGSPHGNSIQYSDVKPMPPNVNFQASCNTGTIDTYYLNPNCNEFTKNDSFAYSMIDNGVGALVASMRPAGAMYTGSYPAIGVTWGTCGDLGYYLMNNLLTKNCTVGEALKIAKQDVLKEISFEYILYGDPAFNPYEPCNEGKTT